MKLTDIHGKPIVNRRRAVQAALREIDEDLELDEDEDWDDDDFWDDDFWDDAGWVDDVSVPLVDKHEEAAEDNPRL